jgi:hypothetical protein
VKGRSLSWTGLRIPRPSGAGISRVIRERTPYGDFYLGRRYFTDTHSPAIIVAVPARNEAERIERCLAALANQRDLNGTPFPDGRVGVLMLPNNCTDHSFEVARSATRRLPGSVRLYDVVMDAKASHAGGARRAAMDLAAE